MAYERERVLISQGGENQSRLVATEYASTSTQPTAADNGEIPDIPANLQFPLIDDPAYAGKISFEVYKVKPIDINGRPLYESKIFDNVRKYIPGSGTKNSATADDGFAFAQEKEIADKTKENANIVADAIINGMETEDLNKKVTLFFPLSINVDDGVEYTNGNLGVLGAGVLQGLKEGNPIGKAIGGSITESLGNLFDFALGSANQEAAQFAASRLAKFGAQSINTAAAIATQVTVNPNSRTVFDNVRIRDFAFTFKLIPKSAAEAREIANIVKFFRHELYPEVKDVGGLPIAYEFPNVFKIRFLHRGLDARIPKLEFCYLVGVSSSYNPTSATFFKDGHPNEIDMTLRFREMRALHKKDVREGK